MAKYFVSYAIRGYFDVNVEADSLEEAKEKAEAIKNSTEFAELIDPQSELIDAYKEND